MKLQMLRSPRLNTVQGRVQMAATLQTKRIRGSAHQAIRQRILKRDRWLCQCRLCQEAERLKVADEVEHRIPLWAGGPEADANRYAIAKDCHEAKSACEARMRAAGAWLATPCTCGHHTSGAQNLAGAAGALEAPDARRRGDRPDSASLA